MNTYEDVKSFAERVLKLRVDKLPSTLAPGTTTLLVATSEEAQELDPKKRKFQVRSDYRVREGANDYEQLCALLTDVMEHLTLAAQGFFMVQEEAQRAIDAEKNKSGIIIP